MDSQSNLLENFNKSSATMFLPDYNKIVSQTQEMLGSNLYGETQSFKSALEREGQPQISVAKLEEITRNVNYLNSKIVYINFTIENMNKYMMYFTPETKAVLNKFIKELELTSQNLTNEVIQLKEDYTKERVSISEKVHGKVDVNRLVALMTMVDRKTDSKGNELSKEKLQEYEQELERASKENSIAYQEALRIYNLSKQSRINDLRIESEEKNKAVIPDEGLSHDDLKEREFYYNRLVVETRNNDIIDKPVFNQMYDKYLKAELDDPYALELMVQSYLEFYDYYNEAKRRAELTGEPIKSDYANWEEFVDKRMQEEGYKFGNVGKGR